MQFWVYWGIEWQLPKPEGGDGGQGKERYEAEGTVSVRKEQHPIAREMQKI